MLLQMFSLSIVNHDLAMLNKVTDAATYLQQLLEGWTCPNVLHS